MVKVLAFVGEVSRDEAAIIQWAVVPAELRRGRGWITPVTADADATGIAYAAHVDGAFFGILTARAFERHVERRAAVQW